MINRSGEESEDFRVLAQLLSKEAITLRSQDSGERSLVRSSGATGRRSSRGWSTTSEGRPATGSGSLLDRNDRQPHQHAVHLSVALVG